MKPCQRQELFDVIFHIQMNQKGTIHRWGEIVFTSSPSHVDSPQRGEGGSLFPWNGHAAGVWSETLHCTLFRVGTVCYFVSRQHIAQWGCDFGWGLVGATGVRAGQVTDCLVRWHLQNINQKKNQTPNQLNWIWNFPPKIANKINPCWVEQTETFCFGGIFKGPGSAEREPPF